LTSISNNFLLLRDVIEMNKFELKGLLPAKLAFGLTLVAALVACGGGSDGPATITVAPAANAAAPATASRLAGLVPASSTATPIVATFANGFSGTDGTAGATPVSVTGPTTVAFTSAGATPAFAITNGGLTATGATTFGSCIFTITSSAFPAGSPLAQGQMVKVNPCTMTAATANGTANGVATNRNVTLTFGTTVSSPMSLPVTITAGGDVSIGGVLLVTVVTVQTTGAGS
jgi:hypothetical protein